MRSEQHLKMYRQAQQQGSAAAAPSWRSTHVPACRGARVAAHLPCCLLGLVRGHAQAGLDGVPGAREHAGRPAWDVRRAGRFKGRMGGTLKSEDFAQLLYESFRRDGSRGSQPEMGTARERVRTACQVAC
jgi:hypothetical protein